MGMRSALILGLVIMAAAGRPAMAQQGCAVAGETYADGASVCQPALRDGRVEAMLFACENGSWTNSSATCPDRFAYFCRIGPHAVAVGETLLLGAGPAYLECAFPGVLKLNQDAVEIPTALGPPSVTVRGVQLFLSNEGAGLDCAVDTCDGQADVKTLAAVARFVRENFTRLTTEEQAMLGTTDASKIEAVLLARSPIDVIPAFARAFDVPPAQ
jgi:hypothetical protein